MEWDAALDEEEVLIRQGREEGAKDGKIKGLEDGEQQGIQQGIAIGKELGWYWGCCVVWEALASAPNASPPVSQRAKRNLMQLKSLIRTFPIVEALEDNPSQQQHEGSDASLEEHMQAVRAKYSITASAFGASPKRPVFGHTKTTEDSSVVEAARAVPLEF